MTDPAAWSEAPSQPYCVAASNEVISSEVPSPSRRNGVQPTLQSVPPLLLLVTPASPIAKLLTLLLLPFLAVTQAPAQLTESHTVRIAVLTLFHPHTIVLTSARPSTIHLDANTLLLLPEQPLTLHSTAGGFTAQLPNTAPIFARTLTLPPSTFTLAVPSKLTRTYIGSLVVTTRDDALLPILAIETELAVASILAAESPPHSSSQALQAQAIASRSFLLAHSFAHAGFDACDTTHCQFLRSPPPSSSTFAAATRATRNLVLTWRLSPADPLRIVPAMYSRSCGGRTRPHPTSPDAYPFYPVSCAYCRRHPENWTRPVPGVPVSTEQQRLAYNRTHGWSAIPSNDHTSSPTALQGRGTGHGIGLCQLGAEDLAVRGATYVDILSYFYPNTSLTLLQ